MTLIALTGGIASGKSTVARRFEALGAHRIDADELSRAVVAAGTPALEQIRETFGPEIIAPDGSLDRKGLAARVFGEPKQLVKLNAIVHPAVRELAEERISQARAVDPDGVIVYEIPLLAETGGVEGWDLVVVADAPAKMRVQRLQDLRGMTLEEAKRRVESQASDAQRREIADVLIDTSRDIEHTLSQVDAIWDRLRGAASERLSE